MPNIEELEARISSLYRAIEEEDSTEIPLSLKAKILSSYSENYLSSAEALHESKPQNVLPGLQLAGQAIELILKATLAAGGNEPPHGHDLISLCKQSVDLGFDLSPEDIAAVIHLSHHYYQDLSTGTKFKSRYPSDYIERVGGTVPEISTFREIQENLGDQIRGRNEESK